MMVGGGGGGGMMDNPSTGPGGMAPQGRIQRIESLQQVGKKPSFCRVKSPFPSRISREKSPGPSFSVARIEGQGAKARQDSSAKLSERNEVDSTQFTTVSFLKKC